MAYFHPLPGRVLTLAGMLLALAPCSQATSPAPTADTLIYETREGDTLIALGERLLARPQDWRQVAALNRIEAPRRIPVGTRLRFPVRLLKHEPRDGTVLAAVGDASLQAPDGAPRSIRQGDALPPGSVVRTAGNGYVTVKIGRAHV